MSFRAEFPEYPAGDIPSVVLKEPWRDESWHNDACPSFSRALGGKRSVHVYVDHLDPAMRVNPDVTRFQAHVTDDEGSFREAAADIFESDNLDDILAWSSAKRLVDVVASGADDQRVTIERLFFEDGYTPDEQRTFLAAIDRDGLYEASDETHGIKFTARLVPSMEE
jgi:hypothetical protein